jgi:hypothetical protein
MSRFSVAALALPLVLLWTAAAPAEGVKPGHISAEAKWYGHFDCEAIRALPIVQEMKKKCPMCWDKGHKLAEKIGVNPMSDLTALTVYSTQYEGKKGVGLFYVKNLKADKLVGAFKRKHPDHKTTKHGKLTVYSWTAKHKHHEMKLSGAIVDNSVVVIGADGDEVRLALDVLTGNKPGLAAGDDLLKGMPKRALFASKAIDVPADYREKTKCPVLRNCTEASAAWQGKKKRIRGKYDFTTVSADDAQNFADLVAGFKAMVDLRMGDVAAVDKMLSGLKASAKGKQFQATWKFSTDDLHAAVKEAIARKMHHKAKGAYDKSGDAKAKKCPTKKCPAAKPAAKKADKPCPAKKAAGKKAEKKCPAKKSAKK